MLLYSFNGYIVARSERGDPITGEREPFHAYVGPGQVRPLEWWDVKWNEYLDDTTPAFHVPLEFDIDVELFDRVVNRCTQKGITPDDLVNRLLRQYVAVGDGTAPEPTLGCHRPEYTFDGYVDYRSSTTIPIIAELEAFREFTKDRGAMLLADWIETWNQFCNLQDARDEADTQADALR